MFSGPLFFFFNIGPNPWFHNFILDLESANWANVFVLWVLFGFGSAHVRIRELFEGKNSFFFQKAPGIKQTETLY